MNKKAQISSQIFIYVLSAVIVAIILIVGFRAISTLMKAGEGISIQEVRTDITSAIEKSSKQYGSVKKVPINVPDKFTEICFADSMTDADIFSSDVKSNTKLKDYFFIEGSINNDARTNVFLLNDQNIEESFYVENLDVRENFLCLDNVGLLEIWLKGLGKKAELYVQNE